MSEADLAFAPRPGLTAWLGASLLLASISSALAWSQGVVTLPAHLVTTVPMLYFVFICIHDGVHGALNRDRRVSDAIAWVMGSITVLPVPLLRQAHLKHHERVGREDDPEFVVYGATLPALLLRLPLVPLYYLREVRHLGTAAALGVVLHFVAWAALVATFGAPLVVGWLLPVGLAVVWFGFTTVYVPHSAHRKRLMPYFNFHSGYHDDHHRDPRYPFHQYFRLRLDGLRHHGALPTHRWEERWLALATWEPRTPGSSEPGTEIRSGS